jgi:hypothetical protein
VRAFDVLRLSPLRSRVKPVQRFFQFCDGKRILATLERRCLIMLYPLKRRSDDGLDKRTIRWHSRVSAPKWPILPFNVQTNAIDNSTCRPTLLI